MNNLIILSVTLVLCHTALAKKSVPNIVQIISENSNCNEPGLQCKDCESIQFCSTKLQSLFSVNCSEQNPATPYCDSETQRCTSTPPESCNLGDSSYICPGIGYYPDTLDCQKYVYCDEEKVAHRYECSYGTVYDQNSQSCIDEAPCFSYDSTSGLCKGKINMFVPYAPNKNLYVLCTFGRSPIVFQCPYKSDIFDEGELSCVFDCDENGFFPYAKDVTKFYACTKIGNMFVKSLLHCYPGTHFVVFGKGEGVCTTQITTTTTTEAPEETTVTTEEVTAEELSDTTLAETMDTTTSVVEENEGTNTPVLEESEGEITADYDYTDYLITNEGHNANVENTSDAIIHSDDKVSLEDGVTNVDETRESEEHNVENADEIKVEEKEQNENVKTQEEATVVENNELDDQTKDIQGESNEIQQQERPEEEENTKQIKEEHNQENSEDENEQVKQNSGENIEHKENQGDQEEQEIHNNDNEVNKNLENNENESVKNHESDEVVEENNQQMESQEEQEAEIEQKGGDGQVAQEEQQDNEEVEHLDNSQNVQDEKDDNNDGSFEENQEDQNIVAQGQQEVEYNNQDEQESDSDVGNPEDISEHENHMEVVNNIDDADNLQDDTNIDEK